MDGVSTFRRCAIGHVAENPDLFSTTIKIIPSEATPYLDGKLQEGPAALEYSGSNGSSTYHGKIYSDQIIEAVWLPDNVRINPPDVKKGERVEIYTMADTQKYYWRSMGLDKHLRDLETVVIAVGARPTGGETPNSNGFYFIEMSGHGKHITISTSSGNGEQFKYSIVLDAAKNKASISDDVGNVIGIESAEDKVYMKTSSGGSYEIVNKTHTLSGDVLNATFQQYNWKKS